MRITSKAAATKVLTDSLFNPVNGKTLNIVKYDSGKYAWNGSAKEYEGREVNDLGGRVHAAYVERRQDSDGAYAQIMCIHE